jgi:hypothetical protein
MLSDQVKGNATRLDVIDSTGTRGVGVLSVQVADVIKDVAELRGQLGEHERKHEQDERARVAGRRWALGFGVAALASLAAMIGLLLDIAATVHR